MSMSSSVIYGYGFPVDKVNGKTVLTFLRNHANTLAQIDDTAGAHAALELNKLDLNTIVCKEYDDIGDIGLPDELIDLLTKCSVDDICNTRAKDIIAAIMTNETGVCIAYEPAQADECSGEASLIFEETMPWFLNEKEKTLTKTELYEILKPYADELGVKNEEIEDLAIEYYG